ncbi:MAG: antibiotic biosynthesis monooxygenase [Planctomycetota bacterium]
MSDLHPVQVVVTREVPPEHRATYEEWLDRLLTAAKARPGFVGATVVRPATDAEPYRVAASFASTEAMMEWEQSHERCRLLREIDRVVDTDVQWEVNTTLDAWFGVSEAPAAPKPIRWRMALVLFVVVSALVLSISPIVRALIPNAPPQLQLVASIGVDVLIMSYFVMPNLLPLLGSWLNERPAAGEATSAPAPTGPERA